MKIIFLYSVKEKLMGVNSEVGWVVSVSFSILIFVFISLLSIVLISYLFDSLLVIFDINSDLLLVASSIVSTGNKLLVLSHGVTIGIAMSKLRNHLLDFQKTKLHYLYSSESSVTFLIPYASDVVNESKPHTSSGLNFFCLCLDLTDDGALRLRLFTLILVSEFMSETSFIVTVM
ncbi:hypothetical protein AGLY_001423 [Aphis glycines]|uniref:Uncharacterized protein n=1 Tax=Aphis glycines TaxID=307491 RepID=A0A6G0U589_APHGL|nr:hypothetical protein AGLY_001423 [Aphis glycines]